MLTKERTSKTRKLKYVAVALALIAVLVFCFASCGSATPTSIEYVAGSAAKVEYNQGESFDCTGAQIKVTYDNGAVETKDVTAEMVGTAPLALGVTTVSVTYSEDGVTVVGYIPVTVKDPYSADRTAAIDGLYAVDVVKNNASDKGVANLIAEYTAKIKEAASKDAIAVVVSNFEAAVADYVADKQAVLDELNAQDLSGLYNQFAKDVLSMKETAIASIKAASTIDEAESYLASFKTAVQNKLAEQEHYEGNETDKGQILDKIDILNLIEDYEERTLLLMEIVTTAYANGEITADAYNLKMYGKPATETEAAVYGYEYVLTRLSWWDKYITLAINIGGAMDSIKDEIGTLIATPVDEIVELITAGVTVLPTEYEWDETAQAFVDGADVTGDLLDEIQALGQEAIDEFGLTGFQALLSEYGVDSVTGDPIVVDVINAISDKYDDLTAIRDAAVTADIIDLIDAAVAAAEGADKKAAVDAAWAALKAWGTANGVFSLDDTIVDINNNLVFDKKFNGQYDVELADGKWNSTNDDEGWTDYEITYDYTELYFVPNITLLVEATQAQDAYEVEQLVLAIGDVILSYTNTDADANARIEAAKTALEDFYTNYGEEVYNEYFVVDGVNQTDLDIQAARAQYTKLEEMAKAANDAIDAYEAFLTAQSRDVVRSDYESSEGLLSAAYKLYCEFAAENTDSNGVIYTDVIENAKDDAGVVTATANETKLIASMDAYVALAYAEERHVQSDKIISAAWLAREEDIPTDETNFRTALQEYKQGKIDFISTDASYDYKTEIDLDGDGTADVVKSNFNYDEVLKANLDVVKAVSAEIAEGIEGVTYENGSLVFPTV